MKNKLYTRLVLSSMALGLAVNQGVANPLGGSVAAGSATISGEGTALTTINQTSPTAIINWQDFSIGLGELTRFIQPGADAAVLNRVLSGSPSQLLGTLQANGQVYLINPNGILVGPSGQINAATFVGSTLDVTDSAFLSGGNMQFLGSTTAGIENLGTINALGGDIFLFGHTVKNAGTLNASGTAGLAAGMSIELRQTGNERIGVLLGNTAAPASTGVDNQGLVQATSVEINAAGGNIYAVAINNGGTVRAQPTLTMEGGKLVLKSEGGTVVNTGTLDASNAGGKGGDIVVAGDKVSLRDGSLVNASGSTGGGTVKVGGGFQGNDASVPNASKTFVGTGATILADATTVGDGGTVIVWSDEVTRYGGSISAKGGVQGGNGGFAEVSGKEYLAFTGAVDLRAPLGVTGTLLLDPRNIQILDGNIDPVAANDEFAENPTSNVIFDSGAIETLLNSANVTLQANNDITVDSDIVATAGAFDLTLQAGRSILINENITVLGSFSATANDAAADGANRVAGAGVLNMAGTAVITAAGNVTLAIGTESTSGSITVADITAGGSVLIDNQGTTAGSSIAMADAGALITAGSVGLRTVNGDIGTGVLPILAQSAGATVNLDASASGNIFAFINDAVQVGGGAASITGISAGGNLSLTAQGHITQTELIDVDGTSTFVVDTATSSDVLLASAANDFTGAITVTEANGGTVRDIAIRNVSATAAYPTFMIAGTIEDLTLIFNNTSITLPATTITGNLVVTAGTTIGQSGPLIVPGTTTLNAGTTITLSDAGNDFTGAVGSTSGGNTTLVDANAIVLGTSSVTGNLSVTAGTGITQNGVLTVTGTSSFTDTGADQDIVLTQANLFTGAVSASGMNVSITDANGLVLGNVTVGGDLTVLATLGDITTDAASTGIIVTGNSSFTANGAGASILLGDDNNNFTGTVSIAGAGGLANVTIFDATALVLNSVTVTGNLTVTATGITQSGVITVGGTTTLDGNAAAIDLGTQNNNFNIVTASDATNLSLDDINDIVLGPITLTGNLSVDSGLTGAGVTGNITQVATTGILNIDGTSTFTVNGANLSNVLLADAANDFTGAITIAEAGAGNVQDVAIRNVSATAAFPTFPVGLRNLTLIFNNAAIDLPATTLTGTLTVTAGGAITDSGTLVVAGTTTLTAGANNITLDDAANNFSTVSVVSGNNVALVDVNGIDLGASTISGTLSVTAGGAVTDSGNVTVAGTTTLAAGAANDITLNSAGNDFNTVIVTTGNNVTLVDTDNIDLGASTISGTLGVTANGAITDSGNVIVAGTTTLAAGAANSITLDQAGNDFNTVAITSGLNVILVDDDDIDLGASTISGTLNVSTGVGEITDSGNVTVAGATATFNSTGAAGVTLNSAGNDFNTVIITIANNATLVDVDDIDLGASSVIFGSFNVTAGGAITDSGNLSLAGVTATFAAGAANNITLDQAGNDFGTVVITSGKDVVLVDIGLIIFGASTVSGTLNVTTGSIQDSGNVTVAGTTTLSATGAIILDSAGNDFNTVIMSGGVSFVTLVDVDDIDLGASTINGPLNVTANGAITDSGNVTVAGTTTLAAGAANDITLNSAGNDFNTVVITTGNNVTLVDTDNIDLGASTISGTLSVTAGGAITDSGTITVAGSTTLTAGAFDITLNDAANDFNAVTVVSGANVTIVDVDDITFSASATLTSAAITGTTITLPAGITTTAAQTYTGAVRIGSDMTLQSTGGGNLTFTSTIDSTAGNVFDLNLFTSGTVGITGAVGATDHLDVLDIRANVINFAGITADTSVTLRPFTANTTIGIEDAAQAFNLTDAELDGIVSPLVTIGDSTAGAITTSVDASVTLGYGITLVNNSTVNFGANTFSTTGALTVNANGAITDASGATITVGGLATFNAGAANSITLGDNGGDTINFGTLTVNGNNVTITEDSATQFAGTSAVAGNLTLVAAGAINTTASAILNVTGNASFNAGANDITLGTGTADTITINFGSVTVNGNNVLVAEDSDMVFSGTSVINAVGNFLVNGSISDDATSSLTANGPTLFFATTIVLGDTATDTVNISTLAVQAGTVTITENSSTVFTSLTPSTTSGSLVINSAGDITDENGVTIAVTGTATFNANGGANNVTLGDNAGDTVNFGSLTVVGNNVTITEDSSTELTGVNTVNGFLALTSAGAITDATGVTLNVTGNASFDATAALITLGDQAADTVNFGNLTFNTTGGAVTITEDSDTALTGTSTGDSLVLVSSGAVQDVSGTSVTIDSGNASFTGTSILLADDNESYSVSGTASFNGGAGAITVGTGATASTSFGKLTFNTSAGVVTITEDDATILTGTSTGEKLTLVSAGSITDDSGTSVTIGGTDATFTGTSIDLADNVGDVLSVSSFATFNAGAGNVTIGAPGTVNFTTLSFTTTAGAVNITEDSSTTFRDASTADSLVIVSAGGFDDTSGASVLIDNGNATFTGTSFNLGDDNEIYTVSGTASFTAGAGAVSIGQGATAAINFGSLTFNTTGGAVSITEDSDTELTGTSTGDSLTLISAGTITDAAATSVTIDNGNATFTGTSISLADNADTLSVSGTASFNGGAGAITVAAAGTVNFGSLTFNTTGGAVAITEDSDTVLTGTSTGDSLTLTSSASITDASGTSVTIDAGNATFNGTSISLADNADTLSVSGIASFSSGAGDTTVAAAGTVNFGQLTVNGANATVTEDSATDFTGSSTLTGALTLTSSGAITDDATADLAITGNANFNAGANNITLGDNAGNDVNFGSLTLNGATVAVTEDSAMTVAGATATTSLTLSANGTVDQSTAPIVTPTLSVTVTTAGPDDADILLNTQDNSVSGGVTFAETTLDALRDVLWRNVSVTATWPTLPGTVTINDLTVQHTMTGISITAALTLKDLAGDSGDLNLLAGAGAITQTGGSTLTIPGTTTLSATGDITLTEANDFDQTVNGTTSLTAGDGLVTVLAGANVNIRDINDIIINASDATTGGTLTSLTVTSDAGTIFVEDSDAGSATAVTITTVNNQAYNGAVILEQDTVLVSTANGSITFSSTVDSDTHLGGAPRDLTVNTGGLTAFNGATLGATSPLDTLTTDAPGTLNLRGTFNTVQFQLFQDPVTLTASVVNNVSGVGNVTYSQTINGTFTLTVNTDENTIFNGAIGGLVELVSVETDAGGTTQINGGVVTTAEGQDYGDAVTLGADAILTSTGLGDITFNSTLNDDGTAGNANLTVNTGANTIFTGAVGNTADLTSLTTDVGGTTHVDGGLVETTGNQTFNDAVEVGADTTFSSTATGNIHFVTTLDGDAASDANANVIVNTQGITTFQGRVGMAFVGVGPSITSLTTDAGGTTRINSTVTFTPGTVNVDADQTVWTLNNQTYNDDVVLSPIDGGDVLVRAESAGATIAFNERVDGTTFNLQGLKIHSDTSSVQNSLIGNQVQLEFFDASTGPNVGFQNITLTQNTEIVAGNVIFGTVTAGAFELTVTANDITFAAGAGSVTGTSDVTLRPIDPTSTIGIGGGAGTFNLDDADIAALADGFRSITIGRFDGSGLVTVGTVTFTDAVRIQSPNGDVLGEGLISSTATPAEGLAAGPIFATDINAAGTRVNSETINGRGQNAFGLVGGASALNGAGVLIFGDGSTTTLMANIQTTGTAIFINDSVQLNTDVSLNTTAGGSAAGNDITITGAINSIAGSNFGLTLRGGTGGNIDIQSTVGATTPLSDIVIPNANNVDFDTTVVITGAITIATANDVIFRSTVSAGSVVQAAGLGTTTFTDNVTTTGAAGVNITTAAITLDGLTIDSTTGNGTIRFNGPVTLSTADVTLSAAAGNITFEGTLNGGFNLALNSTGITTFNGLVGAGTALTSVTTDAAGTTAINGAGVTTTADQTYNDNVTLGVAAVTLTGVNVTFNGTVNGPSALTVTASGVTTFGDATTDTVGGTTPLSSILVNGGGTTVINGNALSTTGTQIYDDAVTLGAGVNFTGSTVTFNEGVNGPTHSLTVTGNAVFGNAAADSVVTASILVTGSTIVNGATVTTVTDQVYNGDVTLTTDVNFTTSTEVRFDEDVLGTPNNLTVTGGAVFGNAANDAVNTGAILVTAGTVVNAGTVTTTGETQTYNGNVTVNNPVNFTGTTVQFDEDIIAGANAVTVTGIAILGSAADDVVNAGALTVTGATTINAGAITTALNQTYTGAVTLGSSTTLTAGGTLLASSTVDGNFDLTLVITGSSTFTGAVGAGAVIGDATGAAITINSTGTTEFQSTVATASGITQADGAGAVTFRDGVTIAAGDTASTFNANVVFDGLTLTSAGAVTLGNAATDTVTLSGDTLTLAVTGATTVNAIVNGNQDLVINSTGATAFNAAVGGAVAATEIGDGTGASITFGAGAGAVTFESTVRTQTGLTQDGTAGLVTFRDNVTVSNGDTASTFNGNVTLDGLTFDSARGVTFGDAATDTVTLSTGTVTLAIDEATVFNSLVDGAQDLIINSLGTTAFNAAVGATIAIGDGTDASITIGAGAGAVTFNSTLSTATGISQSGTAGLVTFDGDVTIAGAGTATTLSGNVVFDGLTFTSAGAVTIGDAATDTLTLSEGDVTLAIAGVTTVNSSTDGAFDLIINSTGATTFAAPVGFNTAIGDGTGASITMGAGAGAVTFSSTLRTATGITQSGTAGTVTFDGDVNILGAATATTLNGSVILDGLNFASVGAITFGDAAADTLTLSEGTVTISSTGAGATGDITINATVTGAQALVVNTAGTTAFNGPVGTPAALLSLTTDAPGTTTIAGGAVTTTGNQTYGDAVTLGSSTTLTAGGALLLSSTLDGSFDLTLTITGSSTFTGAVGAGAVIGDGAGAAITINSTGATEFQSTVSTASGIVQSVGAGTVTFRSDVTIAAGDTGSTFNESVVLDGLTLTSTGAVTLGDAAADTVTLSGSAVTLVVTGTTTVNAIVNGNQDLVINSTGSTTFNAAVGGTTPATEIGDGTGAAITIGAGAGAVTFESTVRTKSGITQAGTAGLVTFRGDVTVAAGDTASTFNGNVTLDGLTFTTAKAVTFGDATTDTVTLSTANVTITATSAGADGAVTFNSAVDGAVALTVNSAGATTFNGVVGPNITTLTTDATGTTTINTATVGGGVLDFNDVVILETSTTLTGTTSVDFASTVDSAAAEANSLTVNSPTTGFHGVVGGTVGGALGTLTTDAAGTTTLDTTAITAAVVDFNDAIVVAQNLTINGTTSIDFASTVNSEGGEANNLTLNSPLTAFNGIVGALAPLGTLSTDAAGTTTINTTAMSAAVLDFNDAIVIAVTTVLNGTTSIDFAGTVNSEAAEANSLTLNSPVTGFHGIVGGAVGGALGTLNTDAAGTTTIDTSAMTAAVLNFDDAVVVDVDSTLTGTVSVDFASTLDSAALENNDLTINSPITGFHGIVGAASPFGTLSTDAAGTTTIDTTAVIANVVDFNDAVVVDQDLLITGITSVDFASTVNSATGEANDLTVNSPTTAFHGIVGGAAGGAFGTLSTDAPGTTTLDTTALTAAIVDFNDAVIIDQDLLITGTTSVDFAGTVNSATGEANDLTINSPITAFHGVVGGVAGGTLGTLTTDAAGTTTIDTAVMNAATMDFNDAIIIDVGTVLTATTLIDFASTVNSAVGEANNLTINSPSTTFNGVVGGTTPLGTLTTDAAGTTTINTAAISASVVDFNDAIVIAVDTTVNGTVSVDFATTVNSQAGEANDLTVNSPVTAFHGIVGGAGGGALGTLSTDAVGVTTIDTTAITGATLDFNDAVTLSQNVVLTGTTTVDFASTVNSDAIGTARTLLVISPLTVFSGAVGGSFPLASLTTDAPGLTRINGGLVTTTGDQLYNDTVRIGATTTLTGNDITFVSLLDSSEGTLQTLTVNSISGGITTFGGAVGTLDRLARLVTNTDGRTDIAGGVINLNGASAEFNDPVLLLANLTIDEDGTGNITFNNTLDGAFALVVDTTTGATIFNGIVGGAAPLTSITTDADGTTQINGGTVVTTGFQLYNDPVTIGANTDLNSLLAGDITFVTTLDGPFTLLVNTAGITTFGGPVGSITPLNSVTTDLPGSTSINGGSVVTFTTQTYNDPVNLGANTIITSTGAAALGNLNFNNTVDGAFTLLVNTAGNTDFNGAVGATTPLVSLTTDAPGSVSIDGGAVTTTGFQLYNDTATIGANTVLTSTGAGNITFMQTLDGAFTLNVNTAGISIFNGVVGGIAPLVSLVTDAPGATQVNGTAVTTTGLQTYNDPTTVGADTAFTSTGAGNITFNGTLDDDAVAGTANVTVNTAGATTFAAPVGGIAPLTSLTTDAPGTVAINGGLVVTTANQTYNDPATLGADTVLTSLLAGNITFAQTLDDDGAALPTSNLIVNTTGVTTFGGVVGGIAPLTSITTQDSTGAPYSGLATDVTAINGGAVTTTGFQLYNDNVTVNQDTVLTSTTVGDITIGLPNPPVPWGPTTLMGTVPGVDMIINALGGNVQINAAVSGVDTLNGFATGTYIAANPGNTGIILYLSLPNSPFVFIYTQPPSSFNLNNKIYSMEEIFGRDVPNLFKYPGDAQSVTSDISVLLTTNRVEQLIGAMPTDKILTSYDLAAIEEARKNR